MGTINFVLIGARNTGKTCYLTVLASHCPCITTASDDTTTYLKAQRKLLDAGELPQATASSMRELFFRYTGGSHKVDFSIDDYDGSFIESLSHKDTEDDVSRNALKDRIQESEGLLFFMPYTTSYDDQTLADFEAEINTIISLAEEITQGKYASLPFPAVICITKWDRSPAYKGDEEIDEAMSYIDLNPYYQRAYAKICRLFAHVIVYPISAFGLTEDGTHPIKGRISPYQLEAPLNFCLDKVFQRYNEKIEDFQNSEDEEGLFDYLFELYDDLKHHNERKYCQLYDDLEQKFSTDILQCINTNQLMVLTDEQASLYECIRQQSIRANIDRALRSNKSRKIEKKWLIIVVSIVMTFGIVMGAIYYIQKKAEKKDFSALSIVVENKAIPIPEIINKVSSFNKTWERFSQDREIITVATNKEIRRRLETLVTNAKNSASPDNNLMHKMQQFKDAVESWSDKDIRQTSLNDIQPFLDSYHTLVNIRSALGKASTLSLNEYHQLKKGSDNLTLRWDEMDSAMKNIHSAIVIRIKAEADNAMASGDHRHLERSSEDLAALSADGVAEAETILKLRIRPALDKARRQQQLYNLLEEILAGKPDPQVMSKIMQEYWRPDYKEDARTQITARLQERFTKYEERNLPVVNDLNSRDQISGIKKKLDKINKENPSEITVGEGVTAFTFRYQRPKEIKGKIDAWKKKLESYEKALDKGVRGYITFKGNGADDDTDPLGFNCTMDDYDLEIKIDKSINLPNDDELVCNKNNNSMRWSINVHLMKGQHSIKVIEDDTLSNDIWEGTFELQDHQIFKYINRGLVVLSADPYTLTLNKN